MAEWIGGVDAENGHFTGEKREFLKCELHRALVRMTLDIGIELRVGEMAVEDVALELGDVDAIGGETAQRLVERRRHRAHLEDETGDDRALGWIWVDRFT